MQKKSINEIQEIYELELDKVVSTVKRQKARFVLLQFPEGLKMYSMQICKYIEQESGIKCLIWMGSCYGGCDVPDEVEKLGVNLIVQFGHSKWDFKNSKLQVI